MKEFEQYKEKRLIYSASTNYNDTAALIDNTYDNGGGYPLFGMDGKQRIINPEARGGYELLAAIQKIFGKDQIYEVEGGFAVKDLTREQSKVLNDIHKIFGGTDPIRLHCIVTVNEQKPTVSAKEIAAKRTKATRNLTSATIATIGTLFEEAIEIDLLNGGDVGTTRAVDHIINGLKTILGMKDELVEGFRSKIRKAYIADKQGHWKQEEPSNIVNLVREIMGDDIKKSRERE